MTREDFKEVTKQHIESCKKILAVGKKCWHSKVRCHECPFSKYNNPKKLGCWLAGYRIARERKLQQTDEVLLSSCREFIKLFEEDKMKIG